MIVNNTNETIKIVAKSKDDFKRLNNIIRPSAETKKSAAYKANVEKAKRTLKRAAF